MWQDVRDVLEAFEMPPAGKPSPETREREPILRWIDAYASRVAGHQGGGVGVTMRRLSRLEYRNTVRDLLGLAYDVERHLPEDPAASGFDNNGDALTLPPMLFEKYVDAAEGLAARAVRGYDPKHLVGKRVPAAKLDSSYGSKAVRSGEVVMATRGDVSTTFAIEPAGRYRVRIKAWAMQAGDELAKLELSVRGERVHVFEIEGRDVYEHELDLPAGACAIRVRFPNDYYDPEHEDPSRRDRNVFLSHVELQGPLGAWRVADFEKRFVPAGEEVTEAVVLRHLLERAFRRPARDQELERLRALAPPDASQAEVYERACAALLCSPSFLYRAEDCAEDGPRALRPYEIASRLSYFLWASMPDSRLFARARDASLAQPAVLEREVRRMVRDPRASALAEGFAEQWLQLRLLSDVTPDRTQFEFDEALREAMHQETLMLFEAVLREDRSVYELLDPGFVFVNERLARHYGIDGVRGAHLRRLPAGDSRRGGLLEHASLLTLTSNPDRTSPVKRGKWVLEALLGDPPSPPPADVEALDESAEASAGKSCASDSWLTARARIARCVT